MAKEQVPPSVRVPKSQLQHGSGSYCHYQCGKMPDKSNIGREGLPFAHSGRVESVLEGRSGRQEPEATGHIADVVSRQRDVNASQI